MPAPFFRQFFPELSHPARVQRFIDNHYHLEMVAENSHQIVEYQAQMLQLQQQAAITNIRAMGEIAHRQDHTNSHKRRNQLSCELDKLSKEVSSASHNLDTVEREVSEYCNKYAQEMREIKWKSD